MGISMEAVDGTSFLLLSTSLLRQNLSGNLAYLARLASQGAAKTHSSMAAGLQMCVSMPSFYVGLGDSNSASYPPHGPHSASLPHDILAPAAPTLTLYISLRKI